MGDVLGLGLIGCGAISGAYLKALRAPEQHDWRLAAVCDVDPEKAKAAAGREAAACTSADELLADPAVDAVVVLLPNHLHADSAIRALEAGRPVLVEKPMATTLPDCDRMVAAAERAGRPLMVGMVNRFRESYRAAWERLRAGEFGTLSLITEHCDYRIAPGWYIRPWLKQAETCGGGMFLQMGIHNLDRAVWLAGSAPLWAHAAIRNVSGVWADETGAATLGLENGVLVQFETDGLAGRRRNETVLHCTEATVCIEGAKLTVHRPSGQEAQELPSDGFANELSALANAVRSGRPPAVDGREGRRAVALALACYESSRTGAVVRLDEAPWGEAM